jgi:hypothetical protein
MLVLVAPRNAAAASGVVNPDGTIQLTVNFRFPVTPDAKTSLQDRMRAASRLLWDATEGQMRIGRVTMACGSVGEDLADFWIFAQPVRSNSPLDALGTRGAHINESFADVGEVYAHEFGHLGFGLGDEYTESQSDCSGVGWCIEETPLAVTERSQCLMQQTPGFSWSEFCTAGNHDTLRGNNAACHVNPPDADGAPCAARCERWNTGTLRYETCGQTPSCWEALVAKFAFLAAPAGLPVEAPPAGFADPVFVDNCQGADTVLLVLDRSGSMAWNVNDDFGEVCGNGADDDGDGSTDETDDCAQARMEFVKAAARSFLALSGAGTFRAGIVSFNEGQTNEVRPTLGSDFVDVGANLAALQARVDGLAPGGSTAIGDALAFGKTLFDADAAPAASKAALIITDGQNTAGSAPASAVPPYQAAGIRIYSISTGGASDDATLSDVSTATRGTRLDTRDGTALVPALVELWAGYTNAGILVPQTPYGVDAQSGVEVLATHGPADARRASHLPRRNGLAFTVEPGPQQFTAVLAGNLRLMGGFGVRARFVSPAGPTFDTEVTAPGLRVVRDRYFVLASIQSPDPGVWQLEVSTAPGAAPVQTGKLILFSENPRTDLFVDADRFVVTDPSDVVHVSLLPSYLTGLRDVQWEVTLTRPDAVTLPVPVEVRSGMRPFQYVATLSGFPYSGAYTLTATVRSTTSTTNDPGEGRPGWAPPNSVPVPVLTRTARLQIYRVGGRPFGDPPPHRGDFGKPPGSAGRPLRLLFRVGSAHPLGSLDDSADANVALRLGTASDLSSVLSLHLTAGLSQFTAETSSALPHPRFIDVSLNARLATPAPSGLRPYIQAGPGYYWAKSGAGYASSAGGNLGLGAELPLGGTFRLELGVDLHLLGSDSARFLTATLGASWD